MHLLYEVTPAAEVALSWGCSCQWGHVHPWSRLTCIPGLCVPRDTQNSDLKVCVPREGFSGCVLHQEHRAARVRSAPPSMDTAEWLESNYQLTGWRESACPSGKCQKKGQGFYIFRFLVTNRFIQKGCHQATFGLFPTGGNERCHVQNILMFILEDIPVQRAWGFGTWSNSGSALCCLIVVS